MDKNKIIKYLYEIETILTTDVLVKLLEEKGIDTVEFLETIKLYQKKINSFNTNEILLNMLEEKLKYFINKSQNETKISLYYTELSTYITFIQDKAKEILNIKDDSIKKEYQSNITYLSSINIKNFYSIKSLNITNIKDKKEIYIVGENGDGKTLLLQAIAIGLKGIVNGAIFDITKSQKEFESTITLDDEIDFNLENGEYQNFFAYGSNRNNSCKMEEDKEGFLTLFDNSIDLLNPIDWLIELYNAKKSDVTTSITLDKAVEIIKDILQKDVEIKVAYNSVEFIEKGTVVEFEQLSAGYRSVIIIICDILKRLSQNQSNIKNIADFTGIVLIDEVELHLHPKWKYEFISTLRKRLPLIQFIVTTHSPTVILGASKEAVFYKIYKENSSITISPQILNKGYTNNTIISSPLFDLETMASRDFEDSKFNSDDFVCQKIHNIISKKIKEDKIFNDEEIENLINDELDKL